MQLPANGSGMPPALNAANLSSKTNDCRAGKIKTSVKIPSCLEA